jgi:hypothetical protein
MEVTASAEGRASAMTGLEGVLLLDGVGVRPLSCAHSHLPPPPQVK